MLQVGEVEDEDVSFNPPCGVQDVVVVLDEGAVLVVDLPAR